MSSHRRCVRLAQRVGPLSRSPNPTRLPPAPVFSAGWHIKPDVVLSIPEHVVSAGNQDDYQYIYVPTNFTEDKWVQASETLPGDRRVVHHVNVTVASAGEKASETEAILLSRLRALASIASFGQEGLPLTEALKDTAGRCFDPLPELTYFTLSEHTQ